MSGRPEYVTAALTRLTRAQKRYVIAGCVHGDCTMATIRALQAKALFYLKITSPNGRCGFMELTPLGVTVQGILKARAARLAAHDQPPATSIGSRKHEGSEAPEVTPNLKTLP